MEARIIPGASALSAHRLSLDKKSRWAWLTRSALLLTVLVVAAWGVPRHPLYQEWRLSRLSIAELERERAGRMEDARLLYHLGRRLNEKERFVEADPLLRRAVSLDPASPRLREEWTRALLGSGLTKAAFGNLRQFVGIYPNLAISHILLGKFYFTQRSTERAAQEMEAALAIEPNNQTAWSYLAAAREALGETQPALKAAERAVVLNRNSATDTLLLAGLLAQSNRAADARREYERSVELAPGWATALREYAAWLLRSSVSENDGALAREMAARAVKADPNDAAAHLTLGRAEILLNRPEAALIPLTRAAALAPNNPAAPLSLTQIHEKLGHSAEAVQWRQIAVARQTSMAEEKMVGELLRAHPEDASLHRRMARLLGRRGDVDGVVHRHASALQTDLDAPQTLIAAANDLSAGGHADKALPLARRALQITTANPGAHEALGNALLGVGQARQAAVAFDKAASWWPERLGVYRKKLAAFYQKREAHPTPANLAYREARRLEAQQFGPKRITPQITGLAEQAVALEPQNASYLAFLLQIQMARQRSVEAERTARRLLAIAPEDGRAHARLALLLATKAARPEEFAAVEAELQAAEYDPGTAATRAYVRGELALKRGDGAAAVSAFQEAAQRDPGADVTYYKLMLAENMAGHKDAANRAIIEYQRRQKRKTEESNLLSAIAQQPNRPELYERAIKFYDVCGLPEQADAVRVAALRRFPASGAATRTESNRGVLK